MISEIQIKLLENYRDKCYVTSILSQENSEFYSLVKSCVNIPLILSSSVMTILNSLTIDKEDKEMKYTNIALNALTALILSLVSNFKIQEKIINFKNISIKMNKLCHLIEDKLTNGLEEITNEDIKQVIIDYDNINETLEYAYVHYIKERVKKRYLNVKSLPNILNCDTIFIKTENII